MGVVVDEFDHGVVGQTELPAVQRVAFHLLFDEMFFGNGQLFALGVNAEFDDLHAVDERLRNVLHAIGRGDEKAIREVEGKFDKMVAEGFVLFAVKHFEKSRSRVAVGVLGQFVDLVEKQERVAHAGLGQGGNDAPGH